MDFKIGDKAVHPAHGVGEVTRIDTKSIGGREQSFYVLRIEASESTVMVPTGNISSSGLRPIISKSEAKEVIDELKRDDVAVTSQPWNRRYREYTDLLNSGSPIEVAKVLRDLSRLRETKDLSFGERRLLEQARELIVKELAIAKEVNEDRVVKDLEKILGPEPPTAQA